MPTIGIHRFILALALLMSLIGGTGALADTGARDTIEAFHTSLLTAMRKGATVGERLAHLRPVVAASFDTGTILRIALGRHWRGLDPAGQHSLQTLMGELIASTYASRFGRFDGESFSTLDEKDLAQDRRQVRTRLTTSKREIVALDYQLVRLAAGWRIYDVVSNGVSDLSLKRTRYGAVFAEQGLDGLSRELQAAIAKNRP